LAGTKPVLAEFEIQEAGIEKGEVELEYRGAYHWGLPQVEEDEEVPLRQSHDFEIQMGITDWWMISTTLGTVVPEGSSWLVEDVELETQFFRHRLWLGHAARYGQRGRVRPDRGVRRRRVPADHEHALQPPGEFAETDSLGFEYGWHGEYDFAKH